MIIPPAKVHLLPNVYVGMVQQMTQAVRDVCRRCRVGGHSSVFFSLVCFSIVTEVPYGRMFLVLSHAGVGWCWRRPILTFFFFFTETIPFTCVLSWAPLAVYNKTLTPFWRDDLSLGISLWCVNALEWDTSLPLTYSHTRVGPPTYLHIYKHVVVGGSVIYKEFLDLCVCISSCCM